MTKRDHLSLLLGLLLIVSACTSNKPSSPSNADANQSQPAATDSAQSPAPNPAPPAPAEVATPPAPPEPPPKPKPKPVVIPSGTVLTVRLQQEVGSKSSQQGDHFAATLAEPLVVNGKTVVPAGASAAGTVTEAHAAGRFKGGATLNIVLESIVIRGKTFPVQTMAVSQTSKGKGKRTAGMIGGGAGGGALIGGLAGGGKGAAIGALVGAGAGTVGAAFTGKRDISLPAETAVGFQMTASLTLPPGGSDDSE
jgi:hypothetical protein